MRVALTGTTGRVGSRLLPRLVGHGYRVRALVRDAEAVDRVAALGAEPVRGDLREDRPVGELVAGADVVLHVAAVLRSTDTALVHQVNVAATRSLADATVAAGAARLVFTSTNLVYPAGLGRPAVESDPPGPVATWGAYPPSKATAEAELLAREDLAVTVLRLAFVYGEGDPHLRESLRWARDWPAHQRFHMVHHADVAQAVLRAIDAPVPAGRIYNVADDAPVSAVELHQLAGAEHPSGAAGGVDPWHGIVSTGRARRELGFRPLFPSAWTAMEAGAL